MGRLLGDVVVGGLAVVVMLVLYPTPRWLRRGSVRVADWIVGWLVDGVYAGVDGLARVARLLRRRGA